MCCLDVFIRYPQQPAEMVKHLCSLTEQRLIVSFAFAAAGAAEGHRQLFPAPAKPPAYTLKEDGIVSAAEACGFNWCAAEQSPFYFSRLIEFTKA